MQGRAGARTITVMTLISSMANFSPVHIPHHTEATEATGEFTPFSVLIIIFEKNKRELAPMQLRVPSENGR
jgi:hypothetical protein